MESKLSFALWNQRQNEWTANDFYCRRKKNVMAASTPFTWLRDLKKEKLNAYKETQVDVGTDRKTKQ